MKAREEVDFTLRNPEEGWNKIGAFHFPGDTASIELSNKTNGSRVIADAVKVGKEIILKTDKMRSMNPFNTYRYLLLFLYYLSGYPASRPR